MKYGSCGPFIFIFTAGVVPEEGNRNVDMKMFLEETFANYTKLIENSNVVAKKIKDKLTLVDVEGNISVTSSSSLTPIGLEQI